ncbi:hypothetical protein JTE90_008838 [Oedothorax gibbosus]|uniref:Adenosine deaminase domain-containing protein n=1 Tax=Oedothorax gibbosus TaxID=931172 RepID=A0AAV6UAW0_9ARAC|nr:hypothetical protein JTE90_008838 [Oedothorax gibbosus]
MNIYKNAAVDTIEDFYNDGVRYLELRTTPKENDQDMTQETYIQSVLKAITHTTETTCKGMIVKLLLSIDRRRPLKYAETTLKVAQQLIGECSNIIGIDLSGDPSQGHIKNFLPILERGKQLGLKLAVHVAELPDQHEEVELLLKMQPDRLGHGTFLHPDKNGSSRNFELLKQLQIPLEICLTSNVACKTVPSYEDHHFKLFHKINYPCVLCTDDKGVFNTSLSDEYYLASQHYSLSKDDLFKISYESISYSFCTELEKSLLRQHWEEFKKKT